MVADMATSRILLATEFSPFPAGRYYTDGPNSGERFREEFLVPALKRSEPVVIELDGTLGFGSSFLEEAFGGLVRVHGYTAAELKALLDLKCSVSTYTKRVWQYIDEEDERRRH